MKSSCKDICVKSRVSDELMKFTYNFERQALDAFGFTTVGHILGYLKVTDIPEKYWQYIVSKIDFIKWDEKNQETVIRCRYRVRNTPRNEKGGDSI